ncbi:nuclease-related domain-containing protein [Halobacillus amylolyticus]|uniref:NERD domain-containing protein n=1 Tax=Halobacillus amylolyticus TaxID=2932259 RepID=A0ABY4HF98_9BACI|nr:nuclease-related domain-containing protein [Halobacillus amylolyticus]UOR13461.1 NERD domain-containing protein [Halobacillus amylolyticus]
MKKRTKTLTHSQLETLLNRLLPAHFKRSDVEAQFLKQSAGHFGESTADHYLKYLPHDRYHVIQDLRLFDGIQYFQIDALIICTEFLLILEVKNYKGKLIFDFEHNQLFREHNGPKDIFADPFLQVEHQEIQLERWLDQFNFPALPIQSFVVVANPNTIIKTHGRDPLRLKHRIVRAKKLYTMIETTRAQFSQSMLAPEQLNELVYLLQKENTPYRGGSILERFDLTVDDLIMGVQCSKCRTYPMSRKRDHWCCLTCGFKSGDAHLKTLRDYQLLIADEITNSEFRRFACLSSRKVAWKLLSETCAQQSGQTKDRKYVLDFV